MTGRLAGHLQAADHPALTGRSPRPARHPGGHHHRRRGEDDILDWRGIARPHPPDRRQIVVTATYITGDERYTWLNDCVCVGTGEMRPRDASGAARTVVGGAIDFVIDFSEVIWEPIA